VGRLSPFYPIADDFGIDLLFYDKVTGGTVSLQVKLNTKTIREDSSVCHFQVRHATFSEHKNAYLLGVLLDTEGSGWSIARAWLVPMKELASVASRDKNVKL